MKFTGANILLYAVPVLLMAILSCLYLHLQKKYDICINERYLISPSPLAHQYELSALTNFISCCNSSTSESARLARWRRPAMVKGPLGIVSWIELSFSFLFVALLAWSSLAYVHGMFEDVTIAYLRGMFADVTSITRTAAQLIQSA